MPLRKSKDENEATLVSRVSSNTQCYTRHCFVFLILKWWPWAEMEEAEGRVWAAAVSHQKHGFSGALPAQLASSHAETPWYPQMTFRDEVRFLCLWWRVLGRAAEKATGTSPSFWPPLGQGRHSLCGYRATCRAHTAFPKDDAAPGRQEASPDMWALWWQSDFAAVEAHIPDMADSSPGTWEQGPGGIAGKTWGWVVTSSAVGDEGSLLGKGKPGTSRSGFPQIKVPSAGKQVWKRLAISGGLEGALGSGEAAKPCLQSWNTLLLFLPHFWGVQCEGVLSYVTLLRMDLDTRVAWSNLFNYVQPFFS